MKWASWTNFVLAAWLIFAPFMFGYTSVRPALYEDVILGIVIVGLAVLILGIWRAVSRPRGGTVRRLAHR